MRVALALCVLIAAACPTPSFAQSDPVGALLRDVQARDFDRALGAIQKLGRYPAQRAQIVPALIQALATGDWDRCGADARDAIARTLGDLKAREAVPPLLDLVKSGKPIEHECFE